MKTNYSRIVVTSSWIFSGLLTFMFLTVFAVSQMSFDIASDSLVGPGALVFGMVAAIVYLVKRDKELRDQIMKQNDELKKSQDARIKELEIELKELRKN